MKPLARNQRGVVLVVSLILLLLLTVLAISASTTSSLQERMAFNAQENNIAFQTAESGLASIDTTATSPMSTCDYSPLKRTYDAESDTDILLHTYIQPVTYASGRTTRASVRIVYTETGDLTVNPGTPITGRYDMSSTATLDATATTAGTIEANTNALHRQGYRCLGFN
ncbi:PilX N-terminal domain-containing pilus assembly protein [Pseudomonas sp. 2FG]|uniref:PilX N-terminal domain-containing pilus assembly protein n=1 Tax=Pseudomonas sp. 2FG TaxID=2502191 RepID=UPI0010F89843|nr:PilX N-terminal domain-containing pilus assembly protein [Pseudomonas sp. 2FG]